MDKYQDTEPDSRSAQQKIIDELLANARKADRIDRDRLELFDALTRHPGWSVYLELLGGRIQGFADEVMRPAGSVDGCVGLEFVKGAMSGLIIARDLASITISSLKASLPAAEEKE